MNFSPKIKNLAFALGLANVFVALRLTMFIASSNRICRTCYDAQEALARTFSQDATLLVRVP